MYYINTRQHKQPYILVYWQRRRIIDVLSTAQQSFILDTVDTLVDGIKKL